MINSTIPDTAEIRVFYGEAFQAYDSERRIPEITVEFYPYVGINHTIRIRDGRVYVRIGEVCREMPAEPHRGLAFILVAKLFRRRVPKRAQEAYSNFIKSDHIREKATARKRARGRKVITTASGEVYDLDEIFDDMNTKYFDRTLAKPVLTWSARKTYRILGHHDSTHETVVISKSLDAADVPRYVVEYIVFHEMLHIHHPTVHHNGRRYNHTPAFRRDERQFPDFDKAERWIERNVRKLKRNARRR